MPAEKLDVSDENPYPDKESDGWNRRSGTEHEAFSCRAPYSSV
jgi:hypothetical protein